MKRKHKHCRRRRQFVRVNLNFVVKEASNSAVVVMFLLASIAQSTKCRTVVIKNSTIAARTGLTNITRIMNELYALGVIAERSSRYKNNRRYCNAYVLSDAIVNPENYVLVPTSVLGESTPSAFRLFLTHCITETADKRCQYSLAQLSELTGMSRTTIIKCNRELEERGFIAKQRYMRRENCFGHNRIYLMHTLRGNRSARITETFRLLVNAKTMYYELKCELENALQGRLSEMFKRAMRQILRSTRVADFIRKLFYRAKNRALFLFKEWGSPNLITRNNMLIPVLKI